MIIKERDINNEEIGKLNALLNSAISEEQKFRIEKELYTIKQGSAGEDSSAYYIDFHLKDSKNWVVIHDIRIETKGRSAQIDHLLINRLFEFYILESKYYHNGVEINEHGEFTAFYNKKSYGVPSPIEQNERHIICLKKFFESNNILPTRLGVKITPTYKNYVLISPKSIIKRPKKKTFNTDNVIKADILERVIEENSEKGPQSISDFMSVTKIVSTSTIETLAKEMVKFHKPLKIDWKRKFKIPKKQTSSIQPGISKKNPTESSSKYFCASCKSGVTEKVAKFCWNNKKKFNGKAYCFNCQKKVQQL